MQSVYSTVPADWAKCFWEDLEIRGPAETTETTTLLRSARILRRVLETWGDILSLKNSNERPSSNTYMKNSQIIIIIMTTHKSFYPGDDVDRLYVPRKEGVRLLTSIEDSIDISIQRLKDDIEKHERGLITAIRDKTDNRIDNRMTITRKQKWEGKQFYARFKRLINNISHDKTWTWLRKGKFKRETESLLMASQNSAIRTNHIKARIDKTQQNSKCRLCGDRDKTINHIISECSKLVQKGLVWSLCLMAYQPL